MDRYRLEKTATGQRRRFFQQGTGWLGKTLVTRVTGYRVQVQENIIVDVASHHSDRDFLFVLRSSAAWALVLSGFGPQNMQHESAPKRREQKQAVGMKGGQTPTLAVSRGPGSRTDAALLQQIRSLGQHIVPCSPLICCLQDCFPLVPAGSPSKDDVKTNVAFCWVVNPPLEVERANTLGCKRDGIPTCWSKAY